MIKVVLDLLAQVDELSEAEQSNLARLSSSWEARMEYRRELARRLLDEAGKGTELSTNEPPRLYSISAAAAFLGRHRNTVLHQVRTGKLRPSAQLGNGYNDYGELLQPVFAREELDRFKDWLDSRPARKGGRKAKNEEL